jgi:hypothetical protein
MAQGTKVDIPTLSTTPLKHLFDGALGREVFPHPLGGHEEPSQDQYDEDQ